MTTRRSKIAAALLFAVVTGTTTLAQSTASISGVVVDADGGVIPGADVVVKNNGTGETFNTVSSEQGVFSVPALITGTYTVTVSLEGFKTVVLEQRGGQRRRAGERARDARDRRADRQVIVQANSELVQTQIGHGVDDARHAPGGEPAALEPQRLRLRRVPARRARRPAAAATRSSTACRRAPST